MMLASQELVPSVCTRHSWGMFISKTCLRVANETFKETPRAHFAPNDAVSRKPTCIFRTNDPEDRNRGSSVKHEINVDNTHTLTTYLRRRLANGTTRKVHARRAKLNTESARIREVATHRLRVTD